MYQYTIRCDHIVQNYERTVNQYEENTPHYTDV